MKVLVVTEIRLYRDGVADALRRNPDVEEAVTAASGPSAVMTAHRHECDVVLLDMAMRDSTRVVRSLTTMRRGLKVVALGVPEDGPEIVECAEAGICGYVSRDASLGELVDALRMALRGEAPISGRVAAGLLRHIAVQATSRNGRAVSPELTPREREVVHLMEVGMSNRQIARALDLQVSTVKNHVHNVLHKYGVAGRHDLVSPGLTVPQP